MSNRTTKKHHKIEVISFISLIKFRSQKSIPCFRNRKIYTDSHRNIYGNEKLKNIFANILFFKEKYNNKKAEILRIVTRTFSFGECQRTLGHWQ